MKPTPLLFLSDSPHLATGLSRITRDLATHVCSLPQFRVGTMGLGGNGSSKLPWAQYCFDETHQWGEEHIEENWDDFAGSERGIIMTIWDLSRLDWFARPKMGGRLQKFLESKKFLKWAYVPVDHYGIDGKVTSLAADTLLGFDRVLAYTLFGKKVLEDTLGREVDWIPHGFRGDVFMPRDKAPGRAMLGVKPDEELIGCVMTNQARKDWGVCISTWQRLRRPGRRFWAHVDTPTRYWNLYALLADFEFAEDDVIMTFNGMFDNETLSYLYSACDVTMLPSLGEGFGYPIVESLACGVPVVHTNYGGGAELIPEKEWLVDKVGERLDTLWNCVRPVLSPINWAEKVEWAVTQHADGTYKDVCVRSVEHLEWQKLWPSCWQKWFLEGVRSE